MPFIESADHTSLFVTDWGIGPPVVFVHARGLRSDQWNYLWGSKTRPPVLTWALCGPLVLVDEAAEDRPTLEPLLGEVGDRVVGPGRAELPAAVGAPPVVMGCVLGQGSSADAVRRRSASGR